MVSKDQEGHQKVRMLSVKDYIRLLWVDPEMVARLQRLQFDDAKRVSDFVAILTRFVFASSFVVFCYGKLIDDESILLKSTYATALIVSFLVAGYMAMQALGVVQSYFIAFASARSNFAVKVALLLLGFWCYVSLVVAMQEAVVALVSKAKL